MTCHHRSFLHRCLRVIHPELAIVLSLVVCALASAQTAEIKTNTTWLSLAELLKKWEGTPWKQVEQEAEKGNPMAQHYLGYCYMEGLRVAQNPETGAIWYQRALTNGYLPSANNLGLAYQRGLLGSNDLNRAVYYYTYAADRGLAQAQFNLGVLYRDGVGVQRSAKEAMKWFRLAAKNGHPNAFVEIGRLYRFGFGVETNKAEAENWFRKAADEGDALAQFNLGLLYEDEGRQEEAIQFYQRAAEQGRADAMTQLYLCFWEGRGVAPSHAKAMQWLTKAADTGDPYAECLMGYRCENPEWEGEGANRHLPQPNWLEAFKWYRRSAEQNWAGGQYHLGLCYMAGRVVELDEERGLELVRAAADQGLEAAIHELAGLYARGVGGPRDESDRPVPLLQRARAWDDLLFRYEHGLGTERDLVVAAQCYCRAVRAGSYYYSLDDKLEYHPRKRLWGTPLIVAPDGHTQIVSPAHESDSEASDEVLRVLSVYLKAAKGDGPSALQIANSYLAGQDAPKSAVNAWAWLKLAVNDGSTEAQSKLIQLERGMNSDELDDAQRLYSSLTVEFNKVAMTIRGNSPDNSDEIK